MSKKEIERGEVIVNILNGKLSKKKACLTMNLSLRQIYRLCRKYKEQVLKGLAHKNRGKSGNRKTSSAYNENRLIKKLHGSQRWENEYAPEEFTITDLDDDEIQATLQNGLQLGRYLKKATTYHLSKL